MVQNEATPLETKAILRFLPPPVAAPVALSAALEEAESAGLLQAVSPSSSAVHTERERIRFMGESLGNKDNGMEKQGQQTVMPPLTCSVWPVTKDEALLAKYTTVPSRSEGTPQRLTGMSDR